VRERDGIELKEMNLRLLRIIDEVTLRGIAFKCEVDELKEK
jgi:hypothetical protein